VEKVAQLKGAMSGSYKRIWDSKEAAPSTRSAVTYKTPEEETAIEKEYQYCFDSYSITYEFIHTLQDASNE